MQTRNRRAWLWPADVRKPSWHEREVCGIKQSSRTSDFKVLMCDRYRGSAMGAVGRPASLRAVKSSATTETRRIYTMISTIKHMLHQFVCHPPTRFPATRTFGSHGCGQVRRTKLLAEVDVAPVAEYALWFPFALFARSCCLLYLRSK